MSVTLKDVASASGVSAATVSRVLSGDSRISEATSRRVMEALTSLGYRNSGGGARTLKGGARTLNVAFLVADLTRSVHEDLFYGEVLGGASEYLETKGYHTLVSTSIGRSEHGELPEIVSRVDGVIAGGANLKSSSVEALAGGVVPAVFIGRHRKNGTLNAILPSNEEGAQIATDHLLNAGRTRLALIDGPTKANVFRDRRAGFRRALAEAGLPVDERLVRESERTPEGGFECVSELLDEAESAGNIPDAIFVADDWIAVGVLRALRQRGLRVPDDIAVVGYNDVALSAVADPPLTTVHVPRRRLGSLAAKLLLEIIERNHVEEPIQISVSPRLVVRESTGTRTLELPE